MKNPPNQKIWNRKICIKKYKKFGGLHRWTEKYKIERILKKQ